MVGGDAPEGQRGPTEITSLPSAKHVIVDSRHRFVHPHRMIDLYTWTTPNGYKISIMLEETGLPYRVIPVDLEAGDQQKPEFTALNPNQKIPAIVDNDIGDEPLSIFESGAILIHLAERSGQLLPAQAAPRAEVLQWLMYQMSHVGPIIGQAGHFANDAPKDKDHSYALGRFIGESLRIVGVLNGRLAISGGNSPTSARWLACECTSKMVSGNHAS